MNVSEYSSTDEYYEDIDWPFVSDSGNFFCLKDSVHKRMINKNYGIFHIILFTDIRVKTREKGDMLGF